LNCGERLAALPPDARAVTCEALDIISRPLTNVELDRALTGILSRSRRRALIRALGSYAIIAILADES
jgi:hypothetical protein